MGDRTLILSVFSEMKKTQRDKKGVDRETKEVAEGGEGWLLYLVYVCSAHASRLARRVAVDQFTIYRVAYLC